MASLLDKFFGKGSEGPEIGEDIGPALQKVLDRQKEKAKAKAKKAKKPKKVAAPKENKLASLIAQATEAAPEKEKKPPVPAFKQEIPKGADIDRIVAGLQGVQTPEPAATPVPGQPRAADKRKDSILRSVFRSLGGRVKAGLQEAFSSGSVELPAGSGGSAGLEILGRIVNRGSALVERRAATKARAEASARDDLALKIKSFNAVTRGQKLELVPEGTPGSISIPSFPGQAVKVSPKDNPLNDILKKLAISGKRTGAGIKANEATLKKLKDARDELEATMLELGNAARLGRIPSSKRGGKAASRTLTGPEKELALELEEDGRSLVERYQKILATSSANKINATTEELAELDGEIIAIRTKIEEFKKNVPPAKAGLFDRLLNVIGAFSTKVTGQQGSVATPGGGAPGGMNAGEEAGLSELGL